VEREAADRRNGRKRNELHKWLARVFILAAVSSLAGCVPPINDVSKLPESITVCGWEWKRDTSVPAMSLDAASTRGGMKAVVVDISSGLCPAGACTAADIRLGNQAAPCQRVIWARVGFDSYVEYGMVFAL
jgi:hypothetical protein